MKYRQTKNHTQEELLASEFHQDNIDSGKELKEQFGLTFPLRVIISKWLNYSCSLCAGWIIPTKEDVERVFNITLEEVGEDNENN